MIFGLKGFSIKPIGKKIVFLKKTKETYELQLPPYSIHNIVIGSTYVWYNGKITANNITNKMRAELEFTPQGWSYKKDYSVKGGVYDEEGNKLMILEGTWKDTIKGIDIDTKKETILAEKKKLPENHV